MVLLILKNKTESKDFWEKIFYKKQTNKNSNPEKYLSKTT